MQIRTALLPRDLPDELTDFSVVVFDVLRATTTMTAALAAGVKAIHIFERLENAAEAAKGFAGAKVLCGERQCVRPAGFDLGNSPGGFIPEQHAGVVAFMCTTNGTRAIAAVRQAPVVLVGALINRTAIARRLKGIGRDILLVCAGTNGSVSMEDAIGAGAVVDAFNDNDVTPADDATILAWTAFNSSRHDLPGALRRTQGGRNVLAAGFGQDVESCARLDVSDVLGVVDTGPLTVSAAEPGV